MIDPRTDEDLLADYLDGEVAAFRAACPDYARAARVDMGFKHCAFVMGALDWRVSGAVVHGYGPLYGAGGAVVEFKLR